MEQSSFSLVSLAFSIFLLRDFVPHEATGVSQASATGSLLYGTFWTVWERSTLLSRAVKQLIQLLVQAVSEVSTGELIISPWRVRYTTIDNCHLGHICDRTGKTKSLLLLELANGFIFPEGLR